MSAAPVQQQVEELRARIAAAEGAQIHAALRAAGLTSALSDADLAAMAPKTEAEIEGWIAARPGLFPSPPLTDLVAVGEAVRDKLPPNKFMTPAHAKRIEAAYLAKRG